jgi:hypothetical protein
MENVTSNAVGRMPAKYLWACAFLAFVLVESLVIYMEVTRHSSKAWFFHYAYLPVMVSMPFTMGWPAYRGLKSSLEATNCEGLSNRVSAAFATLTLVSYLALLICLLQVL